MNSVTKPILVLHVFLSVIVAIDLTCDSVNTLIQSDVTCICKNAPDIDWLIDDVFNSNCVLSSICVPQYSGYNYSINITENVYKMTINSYDYSNCTKITCKDTSDSNKMQSIIPSSLVFDTTYPTSLIEPGSNNSNGINSVTTGCISGYLDVQYEWYIIVDGVEERYSVYNTSIIDTIDNSLCVNCDTDVNGQRTIGFEHSEASGSGTKTGLLKVSLHHVSTNLHLNLTSRYYYTVKDSAELHLFPSYVQAELRGTVTIPVSWKQKSSATLTIAQDLSGTLTDVLKVNGTEYEVINFWNGKASVELSNGTEIRWANITLTNVALEDEGVYTVKIREGATDEETLYNTGHLRIDTYALPIYINIATSNNLQVNEGAEVKFTCTGNVGRPPGTLELVQFFSAEYSPTVAMMSVPELPEISREMLPNGTFRIQHEFRVNLSRTDNGTTFRCRNVHYTPVFNVIESQTSPMTYVNCKLD
ncbi:uncharacterized protein LOC132713928 [Ruditapes philippinarum]|uniref:uncharacterized protein LOC132713928 n=1 Tax=Ruditapes philippinarum TaxID=129788 RepID=UPI00295BA9E7|nr:uncharacterized protein LOC132713928 [Ruditapes philippinarum]